MRLRFAPSPTGHLHVGNARTALFNWLLARGSGGVLILRIEDTDAERSTAASEHAIVDDLRWLGLDWDEGPDAGGSYGPYRQSERRPLYQSYARKLLEQDQAYYCFCSRERLGADRQRAVAEGRAAGYPGTCRGLQRSEADARIARGERPAIRFRVPEHREVAFTDAVRGDVRFHTAIMGDPVLLRAEGTPAYNFAVVVDDALMEVTHVIRGEDHLSNTPRQILIYESLGWRPPLFVHLPLVLGPDHAPLSKRHGSTSVAEFRSRGYLPEALVNYLALVGWAPGGGEELMPLGELARRFSIDTVGLSGAVFDEDKLAWVNRHYLRQAATERLAALSVPYLRAAGVAIVPTAASLAFLAAAMPIAAGSVDRLDQVPARLALIFSFDPSAALTDPAVAGEMREEGAREVVRALADELASAPRLDREAFRTAAGRVRVRTGRKGKALLHPIRLALTGCSEGPELDLLVPAIERGADLPPDAGVPLIMGCRERAAAFVRALDEHGP